MALNRPFFWKASYPLVLMLKCVTSCPQAWQTSIKQGLIVLDSCFLQSWCLLGSLHQPGKVNLATNMAQHSSFNLPLEKFSYLTGRGLTTFKKDFKELLEPLLSDGSLKNIWNLRTDW